MPGALEIDFDSKVEAGDRAFTFGFPVTDLLGDEAKYSEGVINAVSGIGGEQSLLQMSVNIQPGNSGGPLINDDGEVVGIITSTAAVEQFYRDTGAFPQSINWAVKSSLLPAVLDLPQGLELPEPSGRDVRILRQRAREAVCRVQVVE